MDSLLNIGLFAIGMGHTINIHKDGKEITLKIGKYKIDILGGWGIRLGQFSISLRNTQSGQVVDCTRCFWRIQSVVSGERAKRVFLVDIPAAGTYKVEFINTKGVKVKATNLLLGGLFQERVPDNKISVYIY